MALQFRLQNTRRCNFYQKRTNTDKKPISNVKNQPIEMLNTCFLRQKCVDTSYA